MEPGAPEPIVVRDRGSAWVAYRALDPNFPGWDHPRVTEYLATNRGELWGVLCFEDIVELSLGPPSDERLREHPFFDQGLENYEFHHLRSPSGATDRWIVTFHDETLDVLAQQAVAMPATFAESADAAIAAAMAAAGR